MEVWRLDEQGVRELGPRDPLVAGGAGFIWVDIPTWDQAAEIVLRGMGCHARTSGRASGTSIARASACATTPGT